MNYFSGYEWYCKGQHQNTNKKIKYVCINENCDKDPFCCRECEKEFHDSHRQDCVDLNKDYENRFSQMFQIQADLKLRLQNLIDSLTSRFRTLMKQLQSNMDSIQLIKEKKLEDIKEKIHIVKYLNSFENANLESENCQISEELTQFDQCIQALEDFLIVRLNPAIKYKKKGLELMKIQKWEEALTIFEKASRFNNTFYQLYAWKASALRHMKEYGKAQNLLDQGLRKSEKDALILCEYGNLLLEQRNYQRALEYFEDSLKIDPNSFETLHGKGECLLGNKQYQEAECIFEKIIENTKFEKEDFYYSSLVGLGSSLAEQNKVEEAEQKFLKALEINNKAETRVKYGQILEKKQESYKIILAQYNQAIKLDPKYLKAYIAKIKLFKESNNVEQMLETVNKILNEIDNENAEAFLFKGYALFNKQQHQEAQQYLIKVLEKSDIQPELREEAIFYLIKNWAGILMKKEPVDVQYIIPALRQLKDLDQKESRKLGDQPLQNLCNVGQTLYFQKKFNEASEIFKELIRQKQSDDFRIWNLYCRALFKAQKYKEAIQVFDEILEQKLKMDAWTLMIKGDSLFELDEYQSAYEAYEHMKTGSYQQIQPIIQIQVISKFQKAVLPCSIEIAPIKYQEKIGNTLLKKNKNLEALQQFEKYIQEIEKININFAIREYEDPDQEAYLNPSLAYINMSKALINLKRYDEAIDAISKAQKLGLNLSQDLKAESYFLQSQALEKQDKKDEAKKSFDEAIKLGYVFKEIDIQKLIDKALSLMDKNKFDEARASFVEALNSDPKFLDLYFKQCDILLENSNFEQLLLWIEEAVIIDSKNKKIYQIQRGILTKRIDQLIAQQKNSDAICLLKMVDQKQSEFGIQDLLKTKNWYFQIGWQLLQGANYEEAKKAFDSHINGHEQTKDNYYFNAYFLKALTLYKLSEYVEALKTLDKLEEIAELETLPKQIKILEGDSFFKLKQFDKAYKLYTQVSQSEKNYVYFINAGDSLFSYWKKKSEFNEAIMEYDKAWEKGQQNKDQECMNKAKLHKGFALYTNQQYEKAIEIFTELIENGQQRDPAQKILNMALEEQNRNYEANQIKDRVNQNRFQINDEKILRLTSVLSLTSDNAIDIILPFQ